MSFIETILTYDNAHKKCSIGGLGAELALEKLGHKGGENGEQESLGGLIKSQAHKGRVANE